MKRLSLVGVVVLFATVTGCASINEFLDEMAEQERLAWEPVATPVELSYSVPRVAPQDANQQLQQHGNVSVSVAVPNFNAQVRQAARYEGLSPATSEAEQRVFMRTVTPSIAIEPGQLTFNVKINNQAERIMRLEGTVVRVNNDGQVLNLSQSNYADFLAGMVLPRQEEEFTIRGPAIDELSDGAVIGLFLYDLVTRTDAAGAPTERKNFEWYFVYREEQATRTEETVAQRVRMTRAEAVTAGAPWPVAESTPSRR